MLKPGKRKAKSKRKPVSRRATRIRARKRNPSYPNIEKSGFRKGEYVGYALGTVWRIHRVAGVWHATSLAGGHRLQGQTLAHVSTLLSLRDGRKSNPAPGYRYRILADGAELATFKARAHATQYGRALARAHPAWKVQLGQR